MRGYIKQKVRGRIDMNLINKYLIMFCLVFFLTSNAYALFFSNALFKNVKNSKVILVDKGDATLYLLSVDNDTYTIEKQVSNIYLGEVNGDKQYEGDKRTPEGVYFITSYIDDEALPELYGAGAFPLNYPNIVDRIHKKNGYGIWIHGIDENSEKKFTQGCVAVENGFIRFLKNEKIIGAPVVISDNLTIVDEFGYQSELTYWLNYLNGYMLAWQNNDFENYSSYYHIDFKDQKGEKYSSYLQNKQRLFKMYPYKRIKVSDVKILKANDKKLTFDFRQLYCANNIVTEGYKRLYLTNEFDTLKIIAEEFMPTNYSLLEEEILKFVEEWKNSWRSQEIEKYSTFYSDAFTSGGFNRDTWLQDKKEKFLQAQTIDIKINNLRYKIVSPTKYLVTFTQIYSSDIYKDVGVKELLLEGCPGDFSILKETWRSN